MVNIKWGKAQKTLWRLFGEKVNNSLGELDGVEHPGWGGNTVQGNKVFFKMIQTPACFCYGSKVITR